MQNGRLRFRRWTIRSAYLTNWGKIAATRLEEIARISEPGPGVTRLPFTDEHRRAIGMITQWMEEADLIVQTDAAGTVIGRLQGPKGAGTFCMGSHQDSVRHGGAFDGIMGVLLPILALQKLRQEDARLAFSIECLAFADEEGVRFPTALLGPRALAGTFDPAVLAMRDGNGVSLRDTIADFGLDPDAIAALKRSSDHVLGYLETHTEQGPVLEEADQGLGIVTAICGIERHLISLTGETGHAGTLPMDSRRDALVGAAQIVGEVNRLARQTEGLRGTVGSLTVSPNVVNAVPNRVTLTVELRSPDDAVREAAGHEMETFCRSLADRHGLELEIERTYDQPAQPCDPRLSEVLERSVRETGATGLRLPSGATHDASAMADLCRIAMLFVRCRHGVSHVPEEYAAPEDMAVAIDAIADFLTRLE